MVNDHKILTIIADHRERQIINLLKNRTKLCKIVSLKEEEKIFVDIQTLDVADYIISDKIGIERKAGLDFTNSITGKDKKGRNIFVQLNELIQTFEEPMFILEDLKESHNSEMNPNSIQGVQTKIAQDYRIPIVHTINPIDTVRALISLVRRANRDNKNTPLIRSTSKKLTIFQQQEYFIQGLIDCGPNKSPILLKEFGSPGNVIDAILQSTVIKTRSGNPKGIKGPLSKIKGFGYKFLLKNKELLNNIYESKNII
ncbi:MAG: ERCC4 domain-containing protein [Promethearchaeota archaeon]